MSNEHDRDEDDQPNRPAWVPQAQPDREQPEDSSADDLGADAETGSGEPGPAPVDRSATQSFPPLGPVGPPPGTSPSQPAAPASGSPSAPTPPRAPSQPAAPAAGQDGGSAVRPPSQPSPPSQPPRSQPSPSGQPPQAQPPQSQPPRAQPPQSQPPRAQPPQSQPPQARGPQYPAPSEPSAPGRPSQPQARPAPPQQSPSGPSPQHSGPPAYQPPQSQPSAQRQQYAPPQSQPPAQRQQYAPPQAQPVQYPGQPSAGPAPGAAPAPSAAPGPHAYAPPPGPAGVNQAPGGGGGKRSRLGPILGAAAVAGLIGGGVVFAATRDSGSAVESADGSTTTVTAEDGTSGSGSDDDPGDAMPLGAEELSRSVVQIQLLLDGEPTCTGSGTIVDTEGTVVTNFHVVEQSPICPHDRIGIAISETSQAIPTLTYEADLLAFDSDLDLAVVRIARDLDGAVTGDTFVPVEVGDSDAVALGDEIRVIGYPGIGGETVTFTTGSVSGFAETPEGGERSWLKTDATITGGNSGGLAADATGRFVGIPTRVGTGSGQIVDCRVIADSNGDGRLDNADSCVPIGGFINGIRPVALALPLLEEAATAAPIDQGEPEREEPMSMVLPEASNPIWTSGINGDGTVVDQLFAARAGMSELCLAWDYTNVPTGSLSDAVWLIDGETVPDASLFETPNDGAESGSFFFCIQPSSGGLIPGVYELAWLVDDELVFTEGIIVDEGRTALVEVVNTSDIPLCVVQFNPSGTSTYGLNELDDVLQPGDRITVEVGQGPLDARVINCDGDVRIEDNSGFVISDDIAVTVE